MSSLELLSETVSGAMEEKDRELKRARTVRTDYKRAIEEIQGWIQNAELKVQDRSSEPPQLKENLSVRRRFLCPVLIELKMRMNINIYITICSVRSICTVLCC